MSVSKQSEFVRVDTFGIDPLLDLSYEAIEGVTSYRMHVVTASEQFNPALISFNTYRTANWWRAILVYNGLVDTWEVIAGNKLKIPDINEMTTRLQRAKATGPQNTITI